MRKEEAILILANPLAAEQGEYPQAAGLAIKALEKDGAKMDESNDNVALAISYYTDLISLLDTFTESELVEYKEGINTVNMLKRHMIPDICGECERHKWHEENGKCSACKI
jgi:hypothetical protein